MIEKETNNKKRTGRRNLINPSPMKPTIPPKKVRPSNTPRKDYESVNSAAIGFLILAISP